MIALALLLAAAPSGVEADLDTAYAAWRDGDLPAAATLYEGAVNGGADSADVLFNLGTLELERGRIGEGVPHLLAALRRKPWHPEARFNLERVQPEWSEHRLVVGPIGDFAGWLTLPAWLVALAVANLVLAGTVVTRRWLPGLVLAVGLGAPATAALVVRHLEAQRPLMVARKDISLREGPAPRYAGRSKLEAGAILRPRDTRPGWVEVRTPTGDQGWVPESTLQRIPPLSLLTP